jgi:hypothetical protein
MWRTPSHFIEQILAEATAQLEQRLELGRKRIVYQGRHGLKPTADLRPPFSIDHISPISSTLSRRPVIRRRAAITPTWPTACASCARYARLQVRPAAR